MCKAVGGRRLPGILQPQVTMAAHRKHLTPLLLSLALAATLGLYSRAEAGRLASTVIVGRVTSQGRPVAGAAITVAGRAARAVSTADGRYTLPVPRSSESERITLLARHGGYEPWQSAATLRGDTIRVDVHLVALAQLEDTAAQPMPVARKDMPAAAPNEQRLREGRAKSVTGALASIAPGIAGNAKREYAYADEIDRGIRRQREPGNTEAYDHIDENPFRSSRVAPLSTFSVDVDRASYANVRRFLDHGSLPPKDAVRIEELVNYFPYGDAEPARGDVPLRITTEVAAAPWNTAHDLVRIALRARDVDMRRAPAANLVFLIDVSGSMMGPGRLPLVKQSLALLVNQLREQDRVAIVVYAGNAGLVLPSTPGSDKQRILAALDGLEAGGSTAGGAGIRLAYDVARQNFVRGGNNRVILCTDGDFNVGESSDGALVDLIEQRRAEGSFLTILGFGMGNYKDAKMEKLADAGNGNYGYIDDLLEARKMLVKEMGGTLVTVAKDVKLQVEFNPARVRAYRLLGYEDRLLRDEDFANDAKDAGEVGAGHMVTAMYEVVRTDVPLDVTLHETGALRYQRAAVPSAASDELLHVAMRWKAPDGDRSQLENHPVAARRGPPSESMRFASAVAGFGMLLRSSPYAGKLTWPTVIEVARGARGDDRDGYRADFIRLAELAGELSRHVAVAPVRPRPDE
jgi:Ca-activated chloride channel family protein